MLAARAFIIFCLTLIGLFALGFCADKPPSIILGLVDTLRADYLGCYGFKGGVSPHIDAFASDSIVFDGCVAQASWTKPSIATLFASLYPEAHRVTLISPDNSRSDATTVFPSSAFTLAEGLKQKGTQRRDFLELLKSPSIGPGRQLTNGSLAGLWKA